MRTHLNEGGTGFRVYALFWVCPKPPKPSGIPGELVDSSAPVVVDVVDELS